MDFKRKKTRYIFEFPMCAVLFLYHNMQPIYYVHVQCIYTWILMIWEKNQSEKTHVKYFKLTVNFCSFRRGDFILISRVFFLEQLMLLNISKERSFCLLERDGIPNNIQELWLFNFFFFNYEVEYLFKISFAKCYCWNIQYVTDLNSIFTVYDIF